MMVVDMPTACGLGLGGHGGRVCTVCRWDVPGRAPNRVSPSPSPTFPRSVSNDVKLV